MSEQPAEPFYPTSNVTSPPPEAAPPAEADPATAPPDAPSDSAPGGSVPEPDPTPDPASSTDQPGSTPGAGLSGSGSLDPSVPKTMAEATMGDNPDAPVSSVTVHESVFVRLRDVYAHIESWAARHPELARFLAAELKSSIGTAERLNDQGNAAPAAQPEPEHAP